MYVCVCVYMFVAVQKMAEAHMQNLGVYTALEDPCEGEEDEDGWQGEEASPTKAAGERDERQRQEGQHLLVLREKSIPCDTCNAAKSKAGTPSPGLVVLVVINTVKLKWNSLKLDLNSSASILVKQRDAVGIKAVDICSVKVSDGAFFLPFGVNVPVCSLPLYLS